MSFYPLSTFVRRVRYITYLWSDRMVNKALSSDGRGDSIDFQVIYIRELHRIQFLLKKPLIKT